MGKAQRKNPLERNHIQAQIPILSHSQSHSPGHPASTTIMEIKDAFGSVFEGGPPSNEEWLIVLLLNSLSDGNYNWLRKDLLGFMMNAKITVTSEDIIEQIVMEHQEGQEL